MQVVGTHGIKSTKEKIKKKKRTIMCASKENILMTCGAPVNKGASKYYKIIRAPVRSDVCP